MHLGLVTIVVSEYDSAISFFVDALGFELAEDSPAGCEVDIVISEPPLSSSRFFISGLPSTTTMTSSG